MTIQFPQDTTDCTKAEMKILEFIGNHTEAFFFMTIGQLAEELGVSDATVSRFARHVGCQDFKQLKQLVMEQTMAEGPAVKMAGTLLQEERFSLPDWLERQQVYLRKTMEDLDIESFFQAVEAVTKARSVFIHGKNASAPLASLLFFRLRRLGILVQLIPSGGSEVLEGLAQAGTGDLVIMFSFSKVSKEGQMILEHSREAGYQTLAFTGRRYGPAEEQADLNLFIYRGEEQEYHSMTAATAVLDGLVVAVPESLGVQSAEKLSQIRKLKKKYME